MSTAITFGERIIRSPAMPQSNSRLLSLPSEIRNQIWCEAFRGHHIIPEPNPRIAKYTQDDCRACDNSKISWQNPLPLLRSWNIVCRSIYASRQIYQEAHNILFSTLTLHLHHAEIHTTGSVLWSLKHHLRHLEWTVHVLEDNKINWMNSLFAISHLFPVMRSLVVHAHMRPPDSYEKLVDAVYVAQPLAKLLHVRRNVEMTLKLNYVSHGGKPLGIS
jgi:hypothetical protein